MLPDTSDNHWGSFLTQVPKVELEGGIEVDKISHEPLGFLRGIVCGSQQRWTTVGKEEFTIVSTFCHLEYLLWRGVQISTDHHRSQLGLHFRTQGVRFAGAKDCGAATRELEDGARAVRLHDHAYFC